jgi:uncharacterized repeat protein (TIGR03803 family)
MTMRLGLLVCSVALGAIPMVLTGCGAAPSSAIPGSFSAEALHEVGGDAYRTIYAFRNTHGDGTGPNSPLIATNGVLYGTTYFGGHGVLGNGTVFSLTSSGEERVLHSFNRGSKGINPNGGLVAVDGIFYGTTDGGGRGCRQEEERGCGTVFAITAAGQEHVIYRFKGGTDGSSPAAGPLLWLDGRLYGATSNGGTLCPASGGSSGPGCGTVFSVDTSGNERVLYRFRGKRDGASPNAPLLALDGKLYGTTYAGGAAGSCDYYCGTLFEVTTSGVENVLHRFTGGSDGSNPRAGLTNVDGILYGTTSADGADGGCCGTVFKTTTSGTESTVYSFKGPPDAAAPNGTLVADHNLLYGTSSAGGKVCSLGYWDSGTIFAVSTAGAERVVHIFSCKLIFDPAPYLLLFGHVLYGAAYEGGSAPYGSIFAFTP